MKFDLLTAFQKKKELLLLIVLLGGYVFVSILANLFAVNSRLFSVPYRFVAFVFSSIILFENINRLKKVSKIIFLFWIFYFVKAYYSFHNDNYNLDFLDKENEIYIRIFIMNLFPCLALVSLDYKVVDYKAFIFYLFWIMFSALVINFLYTFFYLKDYNKVSGVFSVYYISSGHFGASLVIFSTYLLLFKPKANLIQPKFLIIGILLGIFAIFISAARSPVLALFIVGLYYILLKRKLKYLYIFLIIIILLIFLIYLSKQILNIENAFVERNYVAIFEGDSSGRESLFSKSFPIFKDHLLLGGRFLYEDGMYPHNIFLELLMSGGILLLTIFGLIFYPLIRELNFFFKFSNSKFYFLLIFAFWIQYFTFAQTSCGINSNVEFWYFSSVVIGISINIYNEKTKSNDGRRNPSRNN